MDQASLELIDNVNSSTLQEIQEALGDDTILDLEEAKKALISKYEKMGYIKVNRVVIIVFNEDGLIQAYYKDGPFSEEEEKIFDLMQNQTEDDEYDLIFTDILSIPTGKDNSMRDFWMKKGMDSKILDKLYTTRTSWIKT